MRRSRIPNPNTAEDILGARLRGLKKKEVANSEEGPNFDDGFPCTCCSDIDLENNAKEVTTGLTNHHAVAVQNEFIYLMGDDGANGKLQVYVIRDSDNKPRLVGSYDPTHAFQRIVLHGIYLLGCKTADASSDMSMIDMRKPNAPIEISVTDCGAEARGLHVQGRYAYVATVAGIAIVDIGDDSPVVVGLAV